MAYTVVTEHSTLEIKADDVIIHDGFVFFVTMNEEGLIESTVAVFNQHHFISAVGVMNND